MIARGVNHVHTTFSADGELELGEIAEEAKSRGMSFILLTDHAEHINENEYKQIVKECDDESSSDFIFVPGLEFMYDGYVHILGIGLRKHPGLQDMGKQIEAIKTLGAVAVLAHANTCDEIPYHELSGLEAVEAWNSRYWGRFAPESKGMRILSDLREKTGKKLPCLCGLDLHKRHHFRDIVIEAEVKRLTSEEILSAIRRGDFVNKSRYLNLRALEEPGYLKNTIFYFVNAGYKAVSRLRRLV